MTAALGGLSAHGSIVLTESFPYNDGPIVGVPGSPWATHSGTSHDALVASGKLQIASARTEDIDAPLTNQPYSPASGAVLYSSFT
ncbi:MAG: hypothetical protein ABIQ35_09045, partial [Verrucomicrobiota bacterium]